MLLQCPRIKDMGRDERNSGIKSKTRYKCLVKKLDRIKLINHYLYKSLFL